MFELSAKLKGKVSLTKTLNLLVVQLFPSQSSTQLESGVQVAFDSVASPWHQYSHAVNLMENRLKSLEVGRGEAFLYVS